MISSSTACDDRRIGVRLILTAALCGGMVGCAAAPTPIPATAPGQAATGAVLDPDRALVQVRPAAAPSESEARTARRGNTGEAPQVLDSPADPAVNESEEAVSAPLEAP